MFDFINRISLNSTRTLRYDARRRYKLALRVPLFWRRRQQVARVEVKVYECDDVYRPSFRASMYTDLNDEDKVNDIVAACFRIEDRRIGWRHFRSASFQEDQEIAASRLLPPPPAPLQAERLVMPGVSNDNKDNFRIIHSVAAAAIYPDK